MNNNTNNTRSRLLIIGELLVFASLILANLLDYIPFTATPFLLLLAWISLWRRKVRWKGVGLKRPTHWGKTIFWGVLIGLGYQLLSLYLIEPLIAVWTGELPDVSQFRQLVGNAQLLLLWLAVSWTLAAFMEEMIFRGYLISRFIDLFGGKKAPVLLALFTSSLLFGLAHLYQDWSGVLVTGLFGLVFGIAYLLSGRNLWITIIAHGIADTLGFILIYFGEYPGL